MAVGRGGGERHRLGLGHLRSGGEQFA
jgi:hypothetical protein